MALLVQMKSRIAAESSPTTPLRPPGNIEKASPYKTSSEPSRLARISSGVTSRRVGEVPLRALGAAGGGDPPLGEGGGRPVIGLLLAGGAAMKALSSSVNS